MKATHMLNAVLEDILAGINQYFLHARMLKHLGHLPLADHAYKESIQAMRQADQLIERMMALGALPQVQNIHIVHTAGSAQAMLEADMELTRRINASLAQANAHYADDAETSRLLHALQASAATRLEFLLEQAKNPGSN